MFSCPGTGNLQTIRKTFLLCRSAVRLRSKPTAVRNISTKPLAQPYGFTRGARSPQAGLTYAAPPALHSSRG